MINTNRIVPVTKVDLISLYGLILLQASGNSSLAKLASNDVEGDCYYVVTALNRANNESPACKPIKVKAAKK